MDFGHRPNHRRNPLDSRLIRFECLSKDRLVQRTTFQTKDGDVTITVNFSSRPQADNPPYSAMVTGSIEIPQKVYVSRQP